MISDLKDLLNLELGLEYCGGMEDLYEDMLRDYYEGNFVETLKEQYAAENWTDYRVTIHGVKSTSLMIGGEDISAKAKELELAAADGNADFIKENHEKVLAQYQNLIDKIKEAIG
ncbi:MAG: hypothetical protein K5669_05275 [Lachnospiraceae bacterium]|nr:hypothetical protein [Lachnospiraceae bacterium]